jgi:hypothetical protein
MISRHVVSRSLKFSHRQSQAGRGQPLAHARAGLRLPSFAVDGIAQCGYRDDESDGVRVIEPLSRSIVRTIPRVQIVQLFNRFWRKGWDSNPRYPCRHAGFQDRCLKPLGHPSRP